MIAYKCVPCLSTNHWFGEEGCRNIGKPFIPNYKRPKTMAPIMTPTELMKKLTVTKLEPDNVTNVTKPAPVTKPNNVTPVAVRKAGKAIGRPKVHATAAERAKAYRERKAGKVHFTEVAHWPKDGERK